MDILILIIGIIGFAMAIIIHEVAHTRGMSDAQYIISRGAALPPPSCVRRSRFT
ncbi:MAG: hypothetical protein UT55_C0065G0007, partial [Candidatus Peregrinibacteria bacterium GW2011_GWE2_39_6]